MSKDIKSINASNFINAISNEGDISAVVAPLYEIYPKGYINDPNTWTEMGPVLDIFLRYKEFKNSRHPVIIEEAGIKTARSRVSGTLENLVRFVGSPRIAFAQIPRFNRHFNDIFDMEVYNVTKNSATLIVKFRERDTDEWIYEQCWWNRGIVSSIPHLWNLPEAHYEEVLCFFTPQKIAESTGLDLAEKTDGLFLEGRKIGQRVILKQEAAVTTKSSLRKVFGLQRRHQILTTGHEPYDPYKHIDQPSGILISETIELDGQPVLHEGSVIAAPYCRFEFTWQNKGFFKNLFDLSIGRYREFKQTSIALEEQLRYSQRQFFDLERSNRQLQEAYDHRNKLERIMTGGFAHEIRNKLTGGYYLLKELGQRQVFQNNEEALTRLMLNCKELENKYGVPRDFIATQIVPSIRTLHSSAKEIQTAFDNFGWGAELALDVTNQIRVYAKMQEQTRGSEEIDVHKLAERYRDQHRDLIKKNDIGYAIHSDGSSVIKGDENQLDSIIGNLIKNAFEAVENSEKKEVSVLLSKIKKENGDHLRIVIWDTGEGIAPDDLMNIFYPFYSTKPSIGTGLGLPIAKKLIDLYKGSINVSSEKGKGTTFTVELWMI